MCYFGIMDGHWTFLTNHAHVLLCLAQDPDATLREVAGLVGITERAAHRIVGQLEQEGALTRYKDGRRNHYEITPGFALRHPLERHSTVGQLLKILSTGKSRQRKRRS